MTVAAHTPVLLVDHEFPVDLHEHIRGARERVWLQFMTYEGDAAGRAVTDLLLEAKARGVDVRVVVDAYTDMMVSDTFHRKRVVRSEVVATQRMWADLRTAGIPVVRTRPLGPLNLLFLFRNHKKIVVVDDVVYLGGINLSDHNFAWHDFMVRFADPGVVASCVQVLEETLAGRELDHSFPSGVVTNRHVENAFEGLLAEAEDEVVLSAPYLADLDLVRRLTSLPKGAKVRVLSPLPNNLKLYRALNDHVFRRLTKAGVEVLLDHDFSHARFLIVDRRVAFITSTNFGWESLRCKDEIGVVVRDPAFVAVLYERLVDQRLPRVEAYIPSKGVGKRVVGWSAAQLSRAALRGFYPIGSRMSDVLDE